MQNTHPTYDSLKAGKITLPEQQKNRAIAAFEALHNLPDGPDKSALGEALSSLTYSASRNGSLRDEIAVLTEDVAALTLSKGIGMPEFVKFKNMQAQFLKSFLAKMDQVAKLNKQEGLPEGRLFWLEHEFCVLKDGLNYWARKFIEDIDAKLEIPESQPPSSDKK